MATDRITIFFPLRVHKFLKLNVRENFIINVPTFYKGKMRFYHYVNVPTFYKLKKGNPLCCMIAANGEKLKDIK